MLCSALLALGLACNPDLLPSVVGVHVFSYHIQKGGSPDGRGQWNNHNPGIYARWDNGLTVGTYENSIYRRTTYLGWTLHDDADRFAVTIGVMTGYDKLSNDPDARYAYRCDGPHGCREVRVKDTFVPMIVPSVRLGITESLSARVAAVVQPGGPPLLHFMLEYQL